MDFASGCRLADCDRSAVALATRSRCKALHADVCVCRRSWRGTTVIDSGAPMVAWRGGRKAAAWMAVCAAPALMLLAAFKILLVHNTEAMFPRTLAEGLSKLADPSRCMQIAAAFGQSIWAMGVPWAHPLLLAAILAATLGLAPRPALRRQIWQVLAITALMPTDFVAI